MYLNLASYDTGTEEQGWWHADVLQARASDLRTRKLYSIHPYDGTEEEGPQRKGEEHLSLRCRVSGCRLGLLSSTSTSSASQHLGLCLQDLRAA